MPFAGTTRPRYACRHADAAAARQREGEAEGPPSDSTTRGGRAESPPFPAWYQNQLPRACDGRSVTAGPHRIPGMPWYYYLLPKLTRQQQMRVVKAPPDPDSDDDDYSTPLRPPPPRKPTISILDAHIVVFYVLYSPLRGSQLPVGTSFCTRRW